MQLVIQLKQESPLEIIDWKPALVEAAIAVQQLNVLFSEQLIHGPLKSNPESETIEGFLGDCNTPPNEFGVVTININDYDSLKIPYLPPEVPFSLYLGDTSERKVVGVDAEGNDIYEVVYAGTII